MYKLLALLSVFLSTGVTAQVFYPGKTPGVARTKQSNHKIQLSNEVLSLDVNLGKQQIQSIVFSDKENGKIYNQDWGRSFALVLHPGDSLPAASFRLQAEQIKTERGHDRNGDYILYQLPLINDAQNIEVKWNLKLNDHANYISQHFSVESGKQEISKIYLIRLSEKYSPEVNGIVDGAPVFTANTFWCIENPMSQYEKDAAGLSMYIRPARVEEKTNLFLYSESMSWGVVPKGQMRRGFLYYLEKVRANPYSQITFYDSWYDLSYDLNILTEADCIDRVKTWGDNLKKRGTKLDCFLWDSGWDDWYNMWEFNRRLKDGFKNINTVAKQYGSAMGAWLSPWGGYDQFYTIRINQATRKFPQYTINEHGFTLTDPNYYHYFKNKLTDLIQKEEVALFKIDGIDPGKNNPYCKGFGLYKDEMHAFIQLVRGIRSVKQGVRLNLTVGTWPSPFWLTLGDNIWKGGADFGEVSVGNTRQRWMNYRDLGVYNCLSNSPLIPVSSLMFHGLTIADYGATADYEMDNQYVTDDIWAYFGNGTGLQELYINPHKLNDKMWDELAKAIKWSHSHKQVLMDSHWVGGDPSKQEVYGYASWNPEEATLMLRNPSDKAVDAPVVLSKALELPAKFAGKFKLVNVRTGETERIVHSSQTADLSFKPFEVKVFDVTKL